MNAHFLQQTFARHATMPCCCVRALSLLLSFILFVTQTYQRHLHELAAKVYAHHTCLGHWGQEARHEEGGAEKPQVGSSPPLCPCCRRHG